jgi:hypothetical protein
MVSIGSDGMGVVAACTTVDSRQQLRSWFNREVLGAKTRHRRRTFTPKPWCTVVTKVLEYCTQYCAKQKINSVR